MPGRALDETAYLAETDLSADQYLQFLADRPVDLLDQGSSTGYPVSLAASWRTVFDRLALDAPAALELLDLCAQLAPEPVPFALFTGCSGALSGELGPVAGDPLKFNHLTRLLRTRALAQVQADSLQLHRLVLVILRSRSAGAATEPKLATVAVRLLRAAVPPDPGDDHAGWAQLLPHVLNDTDASRDLDEAAADVAWLLDRAATYLLARDEPGRALPLSERALQCRRQMSGADHLDTLDSAGRVTESLSALGRHVEARKLNEDTLDRRRQVLGADHPDTLTSAGSLAADLRALDRPELARELDQDTLDRRRRVLGADHHDTLITAINLAADLRGLGRHDEARQLDEDTLDRSRRIFGEDHRITLTAARNLDLPASGRHDGAHPDDQGVLGHPPRIFGEYHPDLSIVARIVNAVRRALGWRPER